jgi:hypothetical protein
MDPRGYLYIAGVRDQVVLVHMIRVTDGVVTVWDKRASEEEVKVLFIKQFVWEQRRWNRWDLVTRVEGMDEAWMDTYSLCAVSFDFVCHTLRNLEKRTGAPEDAGERASEGARRTLMRKRIHPRCRSSRSRHQSRMWVIVVWRPLHGADIDGDGILGVGWDGWRPGGECAVQ